MKLFHLSQDVNDDYDTYSDMVVCAASEDKARLIHPSNSTTPWADNTWSSWANSPDQVTVVYLGEADPSVKEGIVCASFHAG
jgi:hypothetical protein